MYQRDVNTIDPVNIALHTAGTGMGVGGIVLLATIVAPPVVLGLEIETLDYGPLCVAGKYISLRPRSRLKK